MTKSELINSLVARLELERDGTPEQDEAISKAVNTLLDQISDTLNEGGRIEVRGFGSFRRNQWGARYARNPVTGESWRTEPSFAIHFKPGKELRERVNEALVD